MINGKGAKIKATKENICCRFLLRADEESDFFGIIVKINTTGKHVFAHHNKFSVGGKVVLSRPKFKVLFKASKLIHTYCIHPFRSAISKRIKTIHSGSARTEDCVCY